MSILVTGGAGYIGSHCVLALLDRGEKVTVIDNLSTGASWAVPKAALLVEGDIADEELVGKVIAEQGVDSVIHFAASTVVPESVANPLLYYRNNTAASLALIRASVRGRIKHFIFSSTAAVYGICGEEPLTEADELRPMSPYGTSKVMTELILADTAKAGGPNYMILRYFNVAGADPLGRAGQSTPKATHLIKVACQSALSEEGAITVFGSDYPTRDGTCIRDYIHVTDLAEAHLSALDYLRSGGGSAIVNCGYGRGYSVLEVIRTVEEVSGRRLRLQFDGRRPGDPAVVVASNAKIQRLLPWRPGLDDLRVIVSSALKWEKYLASMGRTTAC